jgi:flagellin
LNTAIGTAVTDGTLSANVTGDDSSGSEVISESAGSGITVSTNSSALGPMVAATDNDTSTVYIGDGVSSGATDTAITTIIDALSSAGLGLQGSATPADVTNSLNSTTDAQQALAAITKAISTVSAQRGQIGASVNRLTAATGDMSSEVTNLQSATNGLSNADIGKTVANMTQYNVLQSTGMAALQQSNQAQQAVLKLVQ